MRATLYRWEQQEEISPLSFRLSTDGDSVLFEAHVACVPTRDINGFQAGLWQSDVAELFLVTSRRAGYLEFNFAAGGAWWAASFSEPRSLVKELPECVEILEANSSSDDWYIKARLLGVGKGDRLVGNVCGILGDQPRRYVSLLPLTNDINFHCPQCFSSLQVSS